VQNLAIHFLQNNYTMRTTETFELCPKSHEITTTRSSKCAVKIFSFIQNQHESAITTKQRGQVTFYATAQIFPTYKQWNNFDEINQTKTRTTKSTNKLGRAYYIIRHVTNH